MFRIKYMKPSAGEIRLTMTNYHLNYIKTLFMSYIQLRAQLHVSRKDKPNSQNCLNKNRFQIK